ncbi:MAG: hypothetical protein II862_06780 [Bacteroidales bacterium]|nr:hypothetical protein [Bacteroidales bacterium]
MKKLSIIAILSLMAAAFAVAAVSCKKDKTTTISSATDPCIGMLHFNSSEEFVETQQKVLAMTVAERREWEQQQGFKSYATKCEELFEEFEANGINSDEDIYNFVKKNPDYFYIREEEGELYLTSYLENSSYYQFVDENRMIRIGGRVIKVFDEGIISAPIDEEERLIGVASYYEPAQDSFSYFESPQADMQEGAKDDDGCNCGRTETIVRKTNPNGYERTYVRFYIDYGTIHTGDLLVDDYYDQIGYRHIYYKMKVRPYRKNFGIWFWCLRTISYNVNYTVLGENYVSDNKQGQDYGGKVDIILYNYDGMIDLAHYKSLTGTASTPDASCIITCSTIY